MKYFLLVFVILCSISQVNANDDIDSLLQECDASLKKLLVDCENLKKVLNNIIHKNTKEVEINVVQEEYFFKLLESLKNTIDCQHKIAAKAIKVHLDFLRNNPDYESWLFEHRINSIPFKDKYTYFVKCLNTSLRWFLEKNNLNKELILNSKNLTNNLIKIIKTTKKNTNRYATVFNKTIDNFEEKQIMLIDKCLISLLLSQKKNYIIYYNRKKYLEDQ